MVPQKAFKDLDTEGAERHMNVKRKFRQGRTGFKYDKSG
jgi:hypothetical protein